MTPFHQGPLSGEQADNLNRLARLVEQFSRITGTAPITVNKSGGNPVIAISEAYEPLLAEVISNNGGSPAIHIVKRKTRNPANAIVDLLPVVPIQNVIGQRGETFKPGTRLNIEVIPDWPLPEQWWWGVPVAVNESGGGGGGCCDLSWIGGVPVGKCLNLVFLGGNGSCSCMPSDVCTGSAVCPGSASYKPTPMVYVNDGNIGGKWVATAMKSTCCGCGMVTFEVVDADAGTAKLTLRGFHVACDDGKVFTIDLVQESCCSLAIGCCDPLNPGQQPVIRTGVTYRVKASDLPKTCNGIEGDCGQNFKVWVGCGSCPDVFCDCCCLAQTAPAWYYEIPDSGPTAFTNHNWNGSWVLTHDAGCKWIGTCTSGGSGSGSGSGGETDSATLQLVGGVYVLTHNGSTYQLALDAPWKCCQSNDMPRVSGSEGPTTITVRPMLPNGVCSECTPPDSISVTVDTQGNCPQAEGTFALTKTGSGSTATWDYTGPGPDGVLAIGLSCVNSVWKFHMAGQCDHTIPAPWNIDSVGLPDSQTFGPFAVIWTGQDVSMTDPSPTPLCCNHCVGCVTIDVFA